MVKADLINYFDVWGNEEDGWEINNLCRECTLELPEDFTNEDIVKALIEADFFKDTVTMDMVEIEDLYPYYEISQKNDYMPVCRIEIQEN